MIEKQNIAGVVVLYNPQEYVIDNISSYVDDVSVLYAVDNSDIKDNKFEYLLASRFSNVIYIDNGGNKGIANALNIGAKRAIKDGYSWLLTMDQDSSATPGMIEKMITTTEEAEISRVSIIAPFHANKFCRYSESTAKYQEVLTVMTSGNLINLEIYDKIGGFLDELFIDYVDNEYCLRSVQNGYKVLLVPGAILEHNLGNLKRHKLLWKSFYSTNHSPIRRYYAFRNRGFIIQRYRHIFKDYCRFEASRFFVDIFIVIIYEKQKFAKLKMMLRGYLDYKRGIFGKYRG